jgi:hypothetical protein
MTTGLSKAWSAVRNKSFDYGALSGKDGAPYRRKMHSNLYASSWEVRLIGEAALGWLLDSQAVKVLASVSQAVYLLSDRDELLWLALETIPMHHRCLRVSSPLPPMQVGDVFRVRDGLLMTRTGQILDFERAPVWRPPILPEVEHIPFEPLGSLVQSAYRQLTYQGEPSGWGALIPSILQMADGLVSPEPTGEGIVLPEKAWQAVKRILLACRAHDLSSVLQHAAALVGLGAGLTPSGDDFLGGLFFSIQLLRRAYPEITVLQTWNYSDFVFQCKSQTNLISYTFLKDNSEGHALEPLHRFANSLLAGSPIDQSLPYANELAATGHSTGWDLLTGFLVGMSMTFPNSPSGSS